MGNCTTFENAFTQLLRTFFQQVSARECYPPPSSFLPPFPVTFLLSALLMAFLSALPIFQELCIVMEKRIVTVLQAWRAQAEYHWPYRVGMQKVQQEMEYRAEWAALACAAHSAHQSICCATFCIPTLY